MVVGGSVPMLMLALEPELLSGAKESEEPLSEENENGSTWRNHVSPPSVVNRAVRGLFGGGGGGSCDGAASGWAESFCSCGGSGGSTVARAGRIMGSGCMALAAAL